MAPELPREQHTRRCAPPKRRASAHDQEPDGNANKRARIENDSAQSQYTSSTQSALSTNPSYARQAAAPAPSDENLDNAGQSNHEPAGTFQFPALNTPNLTVVQRATVLCTRLPFSTRRQLSVLDISFGPTCQTNFCAQIEGFEDMWVAKLGCTDLVDELSRHVLGENNTRLLCYIAAGEGSSQAMGLYSGGPWLSGRYGKTVHIIMWPQPSCGGGPSRGPSREISLGTEEGCKEFVEMIGGCWIQ